MDDRISGCTSMKLTSAEGNVYWFRTCDLKDDIWKGGAHMVSWPAGQEIDLEGQDQPRLLLSHRVSLLIVIFLKV